MKELVSIIIPAFQAQQWLAECLRSVLAQSWRHLDIIVVDDGSLDQTKEIAQTFCDSRIRVVSQKHNGASSARNLGLSLARGSYIQFLDADDLLAPQKIEIQLNRLRSLNNPDQLAYCTWHYFNDSPTNNWRSAQNWWRDMSPVEWLCASWLNASMMHLAAWLFPRSLVDAAGNWDESLIKNQDGEYLCRVLTLSKGVLFCPQAESFYRTGYRSSISQQKSEAAFLSVLRSIDLCTTNLIRLENSPRTRQACSKLFSHFAFNCYGLYPELAEIAERRVREYGRFDFAAMAGPLFQQLERLFGWRSALKLHRILHFSRI